jgi:hypothetical protein
MKNCDWFATLGAAKRHTFLAASHNVASAWESQLTEPQRTTNVIRLNLIAPPIGTRNLQTVDLRFQLT